jgi:hypothetical protein
MKSFRGLEALNLTTAATEEKYSPLRNTEGAVKNGNLITKFWYKLILVSEDFSTESSYSRY